MIKFTFKFNTGVEEVPVADCWRDVSFTTFLKLYNLPPDANIMDKISALTGVSVDNLKRCNYDTIMLLSQQISFVHDFTEVIEASQRYDEAYKDFSVGEEEFWKVEAVKQAFAKCDKELTQLLGRDPSIEELNANRINAGPVCLDKYANIDASKTSVLDCYGLVNFFLLRSQSSSNDLKSSETLT